MHKTLFIVAAGLSTRFNCRPKHLAKIKGMPNIEHTLQLARSWYDDIYVVVNVNASEEAIKETGRIAVSYNARQLLIPSGKGDADAVYQALSKVGFNLKHASICWGDAWFKDGKVFEIASESLDGEEYDNIVFDAMCAQEENPYGWFNVSSSGLILDASFASDTNVKVLPQGAYAVHDQCFFNMNVKNFKDLYEKYILSIELKVKTLEQNFSSYASLFKLSLKYEISWYKMINWAQSEYCDPSEIKTHSMATILERPVAMSFNTEEDLEKIENA